MAAGGVSVPLAPYDHTLYIWPDGRMIVLLTQHTQLSADAIAKMQAHLDAIRDKWRAGEKTIVLGPEWRVVPVA